MVPNNCTDNTARAAASFGAKVLECTVPVKSKGEVLHFAYNRLRGRQYDAWLVFDADNVVDRSFLAEMNTPGWPELRRLRATGTAKIPTTPPCPAAPLSTTG